MSEPIIPLPTPKVIPASEEKVFNQQYITDTRIEAMPEQPWRVTILSKAYDGGVGLLPQPFLIQLIDVKGCAALAPQLAIAMEKMIEALGTVAVAARATNTKIITPQNIVQVLAAIAPQE